MRIAILTTGSRGDVQPFIALAQGLLKAGHQVRLVTHADFASWLLGSEIEFVPIFGNARALHDAEDAVQMMTAGDNPFAFIKRFARLRDPLMEELMEQCWKGCQGVDLILASVTAVFQGQAIAEKEGTPLCLAYLQPSTPSWHFPSCLLPETWPHHLGGLGNYLSHTVISGYFWLCNGEAVNRARRTVLDLPPLSMFGTPWRLLHNAPVIYGFSERVVQRPPDWGEQHRITGYWFLDSPDPWSPPAELEAFLADGPAPVMIGFGSMHADDAETATQNVIAALRRTGQRGVLLTGWGGLQDLPRSEQWFVTDAVPHDWLLPRCCGAVHHGGAGTTAASLRAGIPSLVVPFMADQFFWGRQVHRLGVGPAPISRVRLTSDRLAAAIAEMTSNPTMRRRAATLGRQLRREDGVACASDAIEDMFVAPVAAELQYQTSWTPATVEAQ